MEKRWYLCEWDDESAAVVAGKPPKEWRLRSCTEVRLVPVKTLDDAIGEDDVNGPVNLDDDDGLVTRRVAPDSLEAAISGTRRGERWEHLDENRRMMLTFDKKHVVSVNYPTDGWHRVEEPLRCPACGGDVAVAKGVTEFQVRCICGVTGPWEDSADKAREAFRRMGK